MIDTSVAGSTLLTYKLADEDFALDINKVREVLDLEADHIEPPPRIGSRLHAEFIRGMGKQGERFIIILDIDKLFSEDELSLVQRVRAENESARSVAA
jgi:chemotaxis signal transduction protein